MTNTNDNEFVSTKVVYLGRCILSDKKLGDKYLPLFTFEVFIENYKDLNEAFQCY